MDHLSKEGYTLQLVSLAFVKKTFDLENYIKKIDEFEKIITIRELSQKYF